MLELREHRFAWPRESGGARGRIRCTPEDFRVVEQLGFEPDGHGEHLFLRLSKRNANTEWVAARLARLTGRGRAAVGYAGMKDRHAVTEQWFSLHWPFSASPELAELQDDGIEVLSVQRHSRKLRRGALKGNRFEIRVRELQGDPQAIAGRLERIALEGFPNYFGEQRLGRGRGNVAAARVWFEGGQRAPQRHRRGLLLSAARAWLFNLVLDTRVRAGSWNRIMPGETLCLAGSRSFFASQGQGGDLEVRLRGGDVHPSGPLWGRGEPLCEGECLDLERSIVAEWPDLTRGLEEVGMRQERRPLRVLPTDLRWETGPANALELSFALPAGSYATALLESALELEEGQP
jgi:tRNA pseudouridine13 synthase